MPLIFTAHSAIGQSGLKIMFPDTSTVGKMMDCVKGSALLGVCCAS